MIVTENPLPPGRYWIDLSTDGAARWSQWFHTYPGYVEIEYENDGHVGDGPIEKLFLSLMGRPPERMFVIFRIIGGAVPRWPDDWGLGLPNVAEPHVTTIEDVVQRPEVPGMVETAEEIAGEAAEVVKKVASGLTTVAYAISFAAIVGIGAYFLITRRK